MKKISVLLTTMILGTLNLTGQCLKGDCYNGFGTYLYESGAVYEGTFHNGQLKDGTYFFVSGDVYIGKYKNGKREDQNGIYYYHDGRYYEGEYKKGAKIKGKMLYIDDSWYDGEFKNGKRSGFGTYNFASGKIQSGYWENDGYIGTTKKEHSTTYVLIAAIEQYGSGSDLRFTIDDAKAFEKEILKGTIGKIDSNNVISLYDKKATKQQILQKMEYLFSKASQIDKIIFFFSGHGFNGSFVPYDYFEEEELIYHNEIKNIFSKCKANTKIIIADACFSGSLLKAKHRALSRSFATDIVDSLQIAVLMSSRNDETSWEDPKIGHGIFTYYFLESLTPAGDLNNDNLITISEIFYYTRNNTYSHSLRLGSSTQEPRLVGKFDKNLIIVHL